MTVGMIGINVAAFVATGFGDPEAVHPWCLTYGNGMHPVQWVTRNFLHAGFLHLLGNMLFLWTFGLIVEGKIGWWRYLVVYLGLAIVQCALEQVLFVWHSPGLSLGASGVIFGLMAISLIWAPENEVECLWVFSGWFSLIRTTSFDISVRSLAIWYIGVNLFFGWLLGFRVSTPLLHSLGAVLGLVIGIVMVKLSWVDCENWDLFSVLAGRGGRRVGDKPVPPPVNLMLDQYVVEESELRERLPTTPTHERALGEIRRRLSQNQGTAALHVYSQSTHFRSRWELPEPELRQLIDLLAAEKQWADAITFLEEFVRRFPEKSTAARLKLAQIAVRELQRPRYAQKLLASLDGQHLPAKLAQTQARILAEAKILIDSGVLEIEA
jgi:membrane associated rhomboid family serine protease